MKSKELKTKISHAHSLILSLCLTRALSHALYLTLYLSDTLCLRLSFSCDSKVTVYTHTHKLTITCTCCCDVINGTQDLKIFSHADSLRFTLFHAVSGDVRALLLPLPPELPLLRLLIPPPPLLILLPLLTVPPLLRRCWSLDLDRSSGGDLARFSALKTRLNLLARASQIC